MNFGYLMDESGSFAVMDAAFDVGITFFDTAEVYGGPQSTVDGFRASGWTDPSRWETCSVIASAVRVPDTLSTKPKPRGNVNVIAVPSIEPLNAAVPA
jgi:Aldo/keto reductase family